MRKEFSAIKTGLAIAGAAPILAAGAPLINGISEGGGFGGILPEGALGKAGEFLDKVMDSPAARRVESAAMNAFGNAARSPAALRIEGGIGGMIESLRGGLLSKTGGMGADFGADFGARLFPNGLGLPCAGKGGEGFSRTMAGVAI